MHTVMGILLSMRTKHVQKRRVMSSLETAGVVLATILGVAGFCVSVSALSMPRVPSFYGARRAAWLIAITALAASIALISWSAGVVA
jgi:hypothetical protein